MADIALALILRLAMIHCFYPTTLDRSYPTHLPSEVKLNNSSHPFLPTLISATCCISHLASSFPFTLPCQNCPHSHTCKPSNMSKQSITTDKAPNPMPNLFPQATVAGGLVFCSGSIGMTADGTLVEGNIQARTVRKTSFYSPAKALRLEPLTISSAPNHQKHPSRS